MVLFPRFQHLDGANARTAYFAPPTIGSYQLNFRAAGKRTLPRRMERQTDGNWLVERAEPPAVMVKLGTVRGTSGLFDGAQTLAALTAYLSSHPGVWFGVRQATAMKDSRRLAYESALDRGMGICVLRPGAGTEGVRALVGGFLGSHR